MPTLKPGMRWCASMPPAFPRPSSPGTSGRRPMGAAGCPPFLVMKYPAVAAATPEVQNVAIGDAVYALADFFRDGAAAEYSGGACRRPGAEATHPRPHQAAATPLSGLTCVASPVRSAQLTPGQARVDSRRAQAASAASRVQLALLARSAHVIGTASARNLDFVRALGADGGHRLLSNALRGSAA